MKNLLKFFIKNKHDYVSVAEENLFLKPRNELKNILKPPQKGIELGPSYNPILPKKQGYNIYVIDYLDKNGLVEKYSKDPNVAGLIENIEEVDAVDNGDDFLSQLGLSDGLDYFVSSHNFEHLPNPVKFLQRCQNCLKDGGKAYFLIPDRRGTFDYFRPASSIGLIIESFINDAKVPSFSQIMDYFFYNVNGNSSDGPTHPGGTAVQAFKIADDHRKSNLYCDVHCFVFTPASFSLLIYALQELNLINLYLEKVYAYNNFEFIAVLEKSQQKNVYDREEVHHKILIENINNMRTK